MKKLLYITLGIFLAVGSTAFAAPTLIYQRTLLPETTATYDLGSLTKVWRNIYTNQICLSSDCKTAWPTGGGGSGGGTFSTTTSTVSGRLINYPNNNTDIVNIGSNSTTTGKFWFDPNTSQSFLTNASTTSFTVTGSAYIPTLGNLTSNGLIKTSGGLGTLSIGTNGTDYTLISANTCSAGQHVSAVTAAGTITCSADTGTSGTGNVATSSTETANQVAVFTTTAGTPAKLTSVATSTPTVTYPFQYSGTPGSFVGGSSGAFSLAFGTTTSNLWAGTQTFTNAPILSSLTGVLLGNGSSSLTTASTQTCTNQFFRTLSSSFGVTCATVSLTADVSGILPLINGGTATSTFSNGGVVFSDSTKLTQNTPNFFWDNTNNRLGIGTSSPANRLVVKVTTIGDGLVVDGAASGGIAPQFSLSADGIQRSSYGLALGIGQYSAQAGVGDSVLRALGGTGNLLISNQQNGSIDLLTGTSNANDTVKARLTAAGNFGIGSTTPGTLLSVGSTNGINLVENATSTFGRGINLAGGCFAINGSCVGAGSFTNTIANGGTGSTSFSPNSIIVSNAAGTALIATGTQLTVGNIIATTTTPSSFINASTTKLSINNIAQYAFKTPGFSVIATTTGAITGTSTANALPSPFTAQTINSVQCYTDVGTANVDIYHTSTHLVLFNASTTQNINTFTTNNTMTAGEKWYVDVGTPASSPTKVTCTLNLTPTGI